MGEIALGLVIGYFVVSTYSRRREQRENVIRFELFETHIINIQAVLIAQDNMRVRISNGEYNDKTDEEFMADYSEEIDFQKIAIRNKM